MIGKGRCRCCRSVQYWRKPARGMAGVPRVTRLLSVLLVLGWQGPRRAVDTSGDRCHRAPARGQRSQPAGGVGQRCRQYRAAHVEWRRQLGAAGQPDNGPARFSRRRRHRCSDRLCSEHRSWPASRIYRTNDAGARWDLQFTNTDPEAFFDGMAFWDADHGVAVSDSVKGTFVIIRTDDGGRTWVRVKADALPQALPNEGAFAASGTSVAVFGPAARLDRDWRRRPGTRAAHDRRVGGRGRWPTRRFPPAASAGIFSIAFHDSLHGVIVGGDHAKEEQAIDNVAVTSDGGVTWAPPRGRGLSGFRSVVAPVPATAGTFIALGPRGGDISTDDGLTWSPMAGEGADTFSAAPGTSTGWAAGAGGRIARLTFGGVDCRSVQGAWTGRAEAPRPTRLPARALRAR